MTTETATLSTPAADAYAAEREALEAAVEEARTTETVLLSVKSRDEIVALASEIVEVKAKDSKKSLVADVADDRVRQTAAYARLEALRSAASREARVLSEIEKAEASVEKAHAAVVKAAEDAEGWGPERVIDAAKEWEVARNVYRHWHSVAYVIREQGKSPEAALVEVAKAVAADIVSNALHGARTSDEARSMIYKASERGSGVFLRSAGYIVREIADLYRY